MTSLGIYSIIGIIFSLIVTILWLVIGWRAMRAHENLSQSHFDLQRDIRRLSEALAAQEEKSKGQSTNLAAIDPSRLPRFKD